MLKYCGKDLPIIKVDEDVEFSVKGMEITQKEAIGEYNTLLTAKPIEKEQFKESEQYYCIKTAYSQEIYVYYVENEIYIKYTDYHAGVSDVDENGNVLGFFNEPVQFEVKGVLELIGPKTICLQGGMGGTYVKTTGQAGEGILTIENAQTGKICEHFQVAREE